MTNEKRYQASVEMQDGDIMTSMFYGDTGRYYAEKYCMGFISKGAISAVVYEIMDDNRRRYASSYLESSNGFNFDPTYGVAK